MCYIYSVLYGAGFIYFNKLSLLFIVKIVIYRNYFYSSVISSTLILSSALAIFRLWELLISLPDVFANL